MSRAHGFSSYSADAGWLFRACVLLEHVGEEQHLVLHRVAPIRPVVRARALMEVVRNAFFKQFSCKARLTPRKKSSVPQSNMIFSESGRSMSVDVDNRVAFPVFGMFLDRAQPLRYSPVHRERTYVDAARHAARRSEQVLMTYGEVERAVASHREPSYGAPERSATVL